MRKAKKATKKKVAKKKATKKKAVGRKKVFLLVVLTDPDCVQLCVLGQKSLQVAA